MPLEIEIKLKVGSHEAIRAALKRAGGRYMRTVVETNSFFDRPDRSLRHADTGLRVRMERVEAGKPSEHGALLTFKGPRKADALRSREAYDVGVSPSEQIIPLLEAIGFERTLSFEKRRESWELNDCHVELDQMPHVGLFVEIEGPSEAAVGTARGILDMASLSPVEESYSAMMAKVAAQHPEWKSRIRLS